MLARAGGHHRVMAYLLIAASLGLLALVGHGVATGTLQVKGGIARARYPKTFWFIALCLTVVGVYLGWLAGYDFALLSHISG